MNSKRVDARVIGGISVSGTFIVPEKGQPASARDKVLALKAKGLDGDCRITGNGSRPDPQQAKFCNLILVAAEAVGEACRALEVPFVVLDGISQSELNGFVGRRLRLGMTGPVVEGLATCVPRDVRVGQNSTAAGLQLAFKDGGILAAIVGSGWILRDAPVLRWHNFELETDSEQQEGAA